MTGPIDAIGAGMGDGNSVGVDHVGLALGASGVARNDIDNDVLARFASGQSGGAFDTPKRVYERLCRDGAIGAHVRYERADREEPACNGDADVSRGWVFGDNGVSH